MRVCGRFTSGDGETPTEPGPVVLEGCAAIAAIRERHFGTDRTPDKIEPVLQITAGGCQWDELFDFTGWRVVFIVRATHRGAVVEVDLCETVARIEPAQERVSRAIED